MADKKYKYGKKIPVIWLKTERQIQALDELVKYYGLTKSDIIRKLIVERAELLNLIEPEPKENNGE